MRESPHIYLNYINLTVEYPKKRFLHCSAEAIYQDYSEFQAVLHPNGLIKWEPGGVFKTMCRIDITYYPFDKQT